MNTSTKRVSKRRKRIAWGAIGAFVLGASYVAANFATVCNSIRSHLGKSAEISSAATAPPSTQVTPVHSINEIAAPSAKPGVQVSTNTQSPNLQNVHGSVRLQYGSHNGKKGPQNPASDQTVSVRGRNNGPVQISTGPQSPNISGVDKDVDIKYNASISPTGGEN